MSTAVIFAADDEEQKVEAMRGNAEKQLKSFKIDGKYQNYRDFPMMAEGSFWKMMKEWWGTDNLKEPKEKLDYKAINPETVFTGDSSVLKATWLGHSSFIIEIDGLRVLLDPALTGNLSPVPWMYSVKRFQKEPPISPENIPEVDAVIISHDHADHLDKETIKAVHPKVGRFIVPVGIDKYLLKWGVPSGKITVLDWSGQVKVGSCTITALPAQHFSGRGLWGRNKTLWASWSIAGPHHNIYFSGDTGYHGPTFRRIGEQHGPFDLVILDTGQFGKYWPYVHMFPEEAVHAFTELKGKTYIPAHWGSFNLSPHSWWDPIEGAIKAAREKEVEIAIPYPGETIDVAAELPNREWWENEVTEKLQEPEHVEAVVHPGN